ncbi:MAG: DUF962 domain-containing protein [Fibrobacteres bacterium]|nr:DUF962 domain-containing protein [Fibrobacterota bacterium]
MKPLSEQLAFYRSYHRSLGCKATHFFGVPLVTFAILVALGWLSFPWPGGHFTGAMAFVLGTLLYYFRLDALLATLMTLIMIPTVWAADWASRLPFPGTLWVFLGSLALGVGFQAWGHILEGKRPALVDNFFQAVFTSPLFLLIEALDSLGWKLRRPAA